MSILKHRIFNSDHFLDKFAGHEAVLERHLARWAVPNPPVPVTIASLKDYLKKPPRGNEPFEHMVETLYQAYDLSTKQGHEFMSDAIEQNQVEKPGLHDLPCEVLALTLQIDEPDVFTLATNYLFASKVDKFVTYKGRESRAIADLPAAVLRFKNKLGAHFEKIKGTDRIHVDHFTDENTHNFIVYHERRMTAEIELKTEEGSVVVKSRNFRPARQDFIAYNTKTGRLEIETPIKKERDLMRTAFAEACLGEADFFSGTGAEIVTKLQELTKTDFVLKADDGHTAVLREIVFTLPQLHAPRIAIKSKDAFATLGLNTLRDGFAGATLKSARIALKFGERQRAKGIELGSNNTISFNRATRSAEVISYLVRWGLIVE